MFSDKTIIDMNKNGIPEISGLSLRQKRLSIFLAVITVLFAINNVIYFTPGFFGALYHGLILIFTIIALFGGGKLGLNIEMFFLYAVSWLSILMNDIPAVYRSEQRCLGFMIVTLLLSPAFTSEFLAFFRVNVLQYLLKGCIVISVLSFIGNFLGFSAFASKSGVWCGITAHSMLLGPIAGISTITLLYQSLSVKKTEKITIFWRMFALISSIFCVLGAASRTAIIATLAGVFIFVIMRGTIQKTGFIIVICLVVFSASFPFVSSLWENVVQKNQNGIALNFDSRISLWNQRLVEFKENPFCGIGFSHITENDGTQNCLADGQIEPGSSWLIILSMMGMMGAAAFLLLLNNSFANLMQCSEKDFRCFLFALGIFWAVEMCAEGFVFASGSFLFFMMWACIGSVEGIRHLQNQITEEKHIAGKGEDDVIH